MARASTLLTAFLPRCASKTSRRCCDLRRAYPGPAHQNEESLRVAPASKTRRGDPRLLAPRATANRAARRVPTHLGAISPAQWHARTATCDDRPLTAALGS